MAALPPPLTPPARWCEERIALPLARAIADAWGYLYLPIDALSRLLHWRLFQAQRRVDALARRRRNRRDQEECFGHVKWESGVSNG